MMSISSLSPVRFGSDPQSWPNQVTSPGAPTPPVDPTNALCASHETNDVLETDRGTQKSAFRVTAIGSSAIATTAAVGTAINDFKDPNLKHPSTPTIISNVTAFLIIGLSVANGVRSWLSSRGAKKEKARIQDHYGADA